MQIAEMLDAQDFSAAEGWIVIDISAFLKCAMFRQVPKDGCWVPEAV